MKGVKIVILFIVSVFYTYGQLAYEVSIQQEETLTLTQLMEQRKNDILPFKIYEFDAQTGGTIKYEKEDGTVSTIVIPPNCLVKKNGKIYKGKVKLIYREIYSITDIILLNVSMKTDKGELLSTYGMFEIYAFDKNDKPLQIAQGKSISVEMENKFAPRDGIGFFVYDTTKNNWIPLPQQPNVSQQTTVSRDTLTEEFEWDWKSAELKVPTRNINYYTTKYEIDITGFGFYNYDYIIKRPYGNLMTIVKFENLTNEEIMQICVIYKQYRAVVQYNSLNKLLVIKNTPFKLVAFTKDGILKVLPEQYENSLSYKLDERNDYKLPIILEEYDIETIGKEKLRQILEG